MPTHKLYLPEFHEKQKLVWRSIANEVLLGGATRGGKSFYIRKAYIRYCLEIPGLQTDIFRLNYDDVIANHMRGETSFPILLDSLVKAKLVNITVNEVEFLELGSRITLKHCADDKVMQKHQGIPSHLRTWEEATQIPPHRILWLNKWVTMSEDMKARVPEKWKGQFPKILYPTNPIGIGAPYFKRNFVDFGAMTIHKHGDFNRQYIPFVVDDNPHEDAQATRRRFETDDPALADAMLNANWAAMVGDFFPEWDETRHVVSDFTPPSHWFRFRGFDWGTAEPFCVYWVAVSDGEPFRDSLGKERWFPRGAYIIYNEWYGCDEKDPAKGLRMRNEDIAQGIIQRSEIHAKDVPTLTDSLPFQDRGGETIAQTFTKNGCPLTLGDTSRVSGWSQMRSRLIGIVVDTNYVNEKGVPYRVPMLYFTERCHYARTYIPALPRHKSESKKEDAAEHGEATHSPDTVRIISMAHTIIKDRLEPMETRIKKELELRKRPTIKNITREMGYGYFK